MGFTRGSLYRCPTRLFVRGLLPFFIAANVALLVADFLPVTIREPRHADDDDADDDQKDQDVEWTKGFHNLRLRVVESSTNYRPA
jgi:hypothetical protein